MLVLTTASGIVAETASSTIVEVSGHAHEYGGSNCGSDCLAVAYGRYYNTTSQAQVGAIRFCAGVYYNYGTPYSGCAVASSTDTAVSVPFGIGTYVDTWLRHGCPAGYYYSSQKHLFITGNDQTLFFWYAGDLTLQTPTQCFPAGPASSPTLHSTEMTRLLGIVTVD